MRFIKILSLLIALIVLTGCSENSRGGVSLPPEKQTSVSSSLMERTSPSPAASSSSENSPPFENVIKELIIVENGQKRSLNDKEQPIRLLSDYAEFYLAMTPTMNTEQLMDKTRKISVERTNVLGKPYTFEYYKTVGLPANTFDELNEKLDGLVGEELKNDFLKMTENGFFTVAENGDLYMSPDPYGRGLGLGMDTLYLDSIEYPDENTVLITVTSFGAKENWGADKDIISKAGAKLVRTSDGLRIEACDITIPDYFGFYDELILDEIPS